MNNSETFLEAFLGVSQTVLRTVPNRFWNRVRRRAETVVKGAETIVKARKRSETTVKVRKRSETRFDAVPFTFTANNHWIGSRN